MIPTPAGCSRWAESIGPGLVMSKTRNKASAKSRMPRLLPLTMPMAISVPHTSSITTFCGSSMPSALASSFEAQVPSAVSATIAATCGTGPSVASAKCSGTAPSEPTVPGALGASPQPNQVAKSLAGRAA